MKTRLHFSAHAVQKLKQAFALFLLGGVLLTGQACGNKDNDSAPTPTLTLDERVLKVVAGQTNSNATLYKLETSSGSFSQDIVDVLEKQYPSKLNEAFLITVPEKGQWRFAVFEVNKLVVTFTRYNSNGALDPGLDQILRIWSKK